MKYAQSSKWRHQNNITDVVLLTLLLTFNMFHFSLSIHYFLVFQMTLCVCLQFPANIFLFKVKNRNRKRCEIRSKLTIKIPERRQWRCSGVFIVNFRHISYLSLVFQLLNLNRRLFSGMTNLNIVSEMLEWRFQKFSQHYQHYFKVLYRRY